MSALPRVTTLTRERIARKFDHSGPDACVAEITANIRQHNPELLDMILKCATDLGNRSKVMQGFGMFYLLLVAQSSADVGRSLPNLLPRVTPATRDLIVRHIDQVGIEAFTMQCMDELEENNPELLQTAHNFASEHRDYLGLMQGFALLYKSLLLQSSEDKKYLQ
jgi:hypothetical protein